MGKMTPGGRYLRSDGVTWQDANGKVLPDPAEAVTEAKAALDQAKADKKAADEKAAAEKAAADEAAAQAEIDRSAADKRAADDEASLALAFEKGGN